MIKRYLAILTCAAALTLAADSCSRTEDPIEDDPQEHKDDDDPGKEDDDPQKDEDIKIEGGTCNVYTAKGFIDALSKVSSYNIVLQKDINLKGLSLPTGVSITRTFDGNNHVLSNITSDHALFAYNSGTIKNLVIGSGSKFGSTGGTVLLAALVESNNGNIEKCVNEAEVSFISIAEVQAVGVAGIAAYNRGSISACTNTGTITFSAPYCSGYAIMKQIAEACPSVGGLVAYGASGFSMSDCSNSGAINFTFTAPDKQEKAIERIQIGGVAGSPCGLLNKCSNSGQIRVKALHSTPGTALPYTCLICVGGIGGGDYYFTDANAASSAANSSYTDCSNTGDITMSSDANKSNSTLGGIVGWPGREVSGITQSTKNCSNSGKLSFEGAGLIRMGGIQGGTGNMENCSNSGLVTIIKADKSSALGGVCAFHSRGHMIQNCTNTGNVIAETEITGGVAGLIGNQGNAAGTTGDGCIVKCTVRNNDPSQGSTGMVIGYYNGTSNKVVMGTSSSPILTDGSIDFGGVAITIDKANCEQYAEGCLNNTTNHTVYVSSTKEAAPTTYKAEGHIKYDDGSPAAGVTVSDGFEVVVTDSNGYYSINTRSDSWYIYFSYPSDAVIEKNATTKTPNFYKRYYATATTTYDFTLKRQAVENEFSIFAMADPQAHYSARSPQKTADVVRFRDESVPALNSRISASAIPCYGVTLGDIVYSEGSRNSNPGMTTMRSYYGEVQMPVFQTMGNHDFTYFYSSSALKTDSSSSTLFLKAQRSFEDCFGPINHSFNRGKVHFVCMRDIAYDSSTDASSYHCGFSNDQYTWLKKDLANVPKDYMVVLCVHIPLATASNTSTYNIDNALALIKAFPNSTVFSGHTHYYRGYPNVGGTGMYEHIHSAVCGQWWWSRIEGDGCPNGYTVYDFKGNSIKNAVFYGCNESMNTKDYQMRIYKGNIKTGGPYAYYQLPYDSKTYLINVFSGDSRWTVKVYENGKYVKNATFLTGSKYSLSSVSQGQTYNIPTTSIQDWWAIGYHIGVCKRGTSSTSYYTNMFHMWKYVATSESAQITVEAIDPYGNVYTCSDVISNGTSYPDYIRTPLN